MENTVANDFSVILLAAGSGLRMGGDVKKQFIELAGRPLIYYPLKMFEDSDAAEIVLVVADEDVDFARREIVERFGFRKVAAIVSGGVERYLSVYEGLKWVTKPYVLVHDGARACVTGQVIADAVRAAVEYGACVVAVPSVDTVKLADEDGFVQMTPARSRVWSIQTPQGFRTELLRGAYAKLFAMGENGGSDNDGESAANARNHGVAPAGGGADDPFAGITDDAMIVERAVPKQKIKLVMGDYDNIKVTTRKDLAVAERVLG